MFPIFWKFLAYILQSWPFKYHSINTVFPIFLKDVCVSHSVISDSSWPCGLYSPSGSFIHGILHVRTRVGYHFLLQRIFLAQGSNTGFLHCRQILYYLSHPRNPFLNIPYYKWWNMNTEPSTNKAWFYCFHRSL